MEIYFKEIKILLLLALPLVFSQLLAAGKGFVDVLMVGNINTSNLAGMSLAFNLYFTVILFSTAMSSTVISVLARKLAHNDKRGFIRYAQQNIYLHILLGLFITLLFTNSKYLFSLFNLSIQTQNIAWNYLLILGIIYPITCLRYVFRPVILSVKKNKILFNITLFGFLLNIPINYILIFGKLGFNEMGAIGSAYSTALCTLLEVIAMGIYCFKNPTINIFKNFNMPNLAIIKQIFNLSIPAGLTILAEYGMFSVVLFMLAFFGENFVAAHQITATNMGFIFIISFVLTTVLNQRISYYIAKKELNQIKLTIICGFIICFISALITILITLLFAKNIVSIYTDDFEIIQIATIMFLITIFYQIFDNFYITSIGILRAYKKNVYILKIVIISYWLVGFPVGFTLSYFYQGYGYWIGFIACFIAASVFNCLKVYKLVWKNS
jgi:multidrug resistance protein, MATE family